MSLTHGYVGFGMGAFLMWVICIMLVAEPRREALVNCAAAHSTPCEWRAVPEGGE